ncbi:hypothetical protein BC830DRAFT_112970 [Chytriomyces sp. MP71]|nr:hypothetical protein BC830DRAFT_112970 [Chytriomyces sp. MP71]
MNATNATFDNVEALIALSNELNSDACWITIAASIALMGILGILIRIETRDNAHPSHVFSPVNIMLLFMIISNCGCVVFFYFVPLATDFLLSLALFTASNLSLSTFEWLVMLYSWNRGKPVISLVFPASCFLIRVVLVMFPLIQFVTEVGYAIVSVTDPDNPLLAMWTKVAGVLAILCSSILILFDSFILVVYQLYLHQIKSEVGIQKDQRLQIISQYGVVSLIWTLLYETVTEIYNWATWDSTNYNAYIGVTTLDSLMPLMFICIQLSMKRALYCQKQNDRNKKLTLVEAAKKVSLNGSKQGNTDRGDSILKPLSSIRETSTSGGNNSRI